MRVVIKMKDGWDEQTVERLRMIGLVTESMISKIGIVLGTIERSKLVELQASPDVQFAEKEMPYQPLNK